MAKPDTKPTKDGAANMTDHLFAIDAYVEQWSLVDRFGIPPFSVLDTRGDT